MKFLELYIGAIILWYMYYKIGKILFQFDKRISNINLLLSIGVFSILLALLNTINSEILHGIIKIIISYTLLCGYYKIVFNTNSSEILVACLILYLTTSVVEVVTAIIFSIIIKFNNYESIQFLKNTIFINILISSFSYLIIILNRKKLTNFTKNSKFNNIGSFVIIIVILFTLSLLSFKIPVNQWKLNAEFIITMIILFCFCLIGLFLIKQRTDIQKTTSMYQQLASYSNITNKLLEDYRVVSHEHKNQLSIIRGMVDNANKELVTYIDNLLNKRTVIKYQWATQLNNIPIPGLKGLLNYKLIEMESSKININISISKDIIKTKLNKLTTKQEDCLYSIIGVYLDNAIEAAKETKKKEISIEIFKEQEDIVIVIANTYKNDIDLNKIDDYGYTTKGKNHGVGLHIVKKILEENIIFSQNRSLFQDYYVQELRIHLSKINLITRK